MKDEKIWKKLLQGVFVILGIGAGFVIGFFGGMYAENLGLQGVEWGIAIGAFALALYLQIIFHEAGHLVFGLLTGYKFVSFRIDSFIIYKKQGTIQTGKFMLAGTGGQCLMSPPDLKDGTMPYCLSNLGGVLMNLIVAGIAFLMFILCDMHGILQIFCMSLIAVGVFYALVNGIPMRMNGIDNDGYNALSLGKDKEALHAFWLQLKINEQQTEGKRLKDMPKEWFEKPSDESMKNSMIAALEAARCNRLLDMQLFEETNKEIEMLLKSENGMVGIQKTLLQLDQIFCEILGERRECVLKPFKEKELVTFMKAMKNYPTVVRTQYAYARLIERDEEKAAKLKVQFEKIMQKHPYEGDRESECELIRCCEQI